MIGEILCGLYSIYCCSFCGAVIYTECRERYEARQARIREYTCLDTRNPPNLEMINEREFSLSRLPTIVETEEIV
tara:strand:+ start:378 stop:602 length:225 start_codon:yes stop_codon:yes gene_type:complete